ncbi:MAG: carbohydrate binding family 9 domain-containing protein [Candidatus Eisenbacteria sp.]|nr:carbohydrate binding family 9 domain-containing protein [Candidatus Eisenbacteria bacterium]
MTEFARNARRVGTAMAVLAMVASPGAVEAEETNFEKATYEVSRAVSPVRIDGVLDEETWKHAVVINLPYEIMPGENIPPPVSTECLITYDDRNLYAGFRAHDPDPSQIRAHYCDRDKAYRNDYVGIMIDPFNDERRGLEFFCNPFGVQMDFSRNDVSSGNQEDATWDAIWKSAGRITDEGYTVEMAIPFTSLRFPRTEGRQTWGFMAFRAYPRTDRHQIGSKPYNRDLNCMVCQWDKIVGFEGITPGRNIEIAPTFTAHRTDEREEFPEGSIANGDPDPELGISARWGITPNWSVQAALNPDFSQIEADMAQLEINTRYALYFPEKRPFFMEGADFFRTPIEAVYTRTVVEPSRGLKLSGKEGRSALGVFTARDDVTSLMFPSNQGSDIILLDQDVTTGVFRYRRDVGETSNLGVLTTAREGDEYRNRVYGVDGNLWLTSKDLIRFQLLGTMTNYPWETAEENDQPHKLFHGFGADVVYQHGERDWQWWAYWDHRDPGFRADVGFVRRVDLREFGLGGQHTWWGEPGARLRRVFLGLEGERTEDHSGLLTDRSVNLFAGAEGPYQSWLQTRVWHETEYYDGDTYDLNAGHFFFNIRPSGDFTCSVGGNLGEAIDYDNSRKGKRIRLSPGLTRDLFRHLYLQVDHTFERFYVDGDRLFEARLHQARLTYQFNIRTFARAIVQYVDIDRNVDLYIDEDTDAESRDLFTQFLFSYKVNPQTVCFLGYSDNWEREIGFDLTQSDRTFFLKIGYAWVQ